MGSTKINFSFFNDSQGLYSKLQSIENRIDTVQTTRQVTKLTRELDHTSIALKEMKNKAQAVFGQSQTAYLDFTDIEEKIVYIHGQIERALVARKVWQIQDRAHSLKEAIDHKDPIDMKTISSLKRLISRLLENFRPGIQDRRVIDHAKQTVREACLTLHGNQSPSQQTISHFEWLARQQDIRFIEEIELCPSQYEDVFDLAALVYNGKLREAKAAYQQLPKNLQKKFHQHLRELSAIAFKDEMETIQALLAIANQLIENGESYPTEKQIDEIFLGLRQVMAEEEKNPIIHPLDLLQS